MIVVIIAGGSGTRLWPLSTKDYPKHLLKLTGDHSLLQNTYDRIKNIAEAVFVVTEKSHARHVYQQLPKLPRRNILVEPARRGTASCLIWALSEINRRHFKRQAIFFLWADHLVRSQSGFVKAAKAAAQLAEAHNKLVFMGVKPTYAATGFGYMQKGKKQAKDKKTYDLKQFVEKPNRATAQRYLNSGDYLWNTGYLLGTVETFERELTQHAPRLWNDYLSLRDSNLFWRKRIYRDFVSEAIDTALSEHIPDALVVEGVFDWADVGSFHDLHGVSIQDKAGNYIEGEGVALENVTNSYVRNEQNQPVAVIGLNDVAVIATKNGFLVTNKKHAQKVGELSKRLQSDKQWTKWLEKL